MSKILYTVIESTYYFTEVRVFTSESKANRHARKIMYNDGDDVKFTQVYKPQPHKAQEALFIMKNEDKEVYLIASPVDNDLETKINDAPFDVNVVLLKEDGETPKVYLFGTKSERQKFWEALHTILSFGEAKKENEFNGESFSFSVGRTMAYKFDVACTPDAEAWLE